MLGDPSLSNIVGFQYDSNSNDQDTKNTDLDKKDIEELRNIEDVKK